MSQAQPVRVVEPDMEFIREVKAAGGGTLKKCYQCATCSMVCNLSPDDKPFPRKEMLWTSWGQTDKLIKDPDVWLCYQCNDCSTYCPRGARPGDVLAAVRAYVYRTFAFPSFMGTALASPKALPVLIGVPILILLACVFAFAPHNDAGEFVFMTSDVIDFDFFLPHSSVDALFVFGNILIFLFAAIGFLRFWKGLKEPGEKVKVSFVSAAIPVVSEIIGHKRFRDCGANSARSWGHMILLFGFIGAMITTGAILLFVFLPHYIHLLGVESLDSWFEVPIDLPHPVKILGGLSGLGLVIGGAMLVYRRWANKDAVGANGYVDYLFLYVIFFTGLTGMFSWWTRLIGIPMLAYVTYFVHMVCVFFLLWYMPYSKFAHMIYRTLALIRAKQVGRLS
jgi:quinone-modifying oxidoreductase subunit QmoC